MKSSKGAKKPSKPGLQLKKQGSATELIGMLGKAPADFNYKEELAKILVEKYLQTK